MKTPPGRTRRQARARSGYKLQKPDPCDLLPDRPNFPDYNLQNSVTAGDQVFNT